MNANLQPTDSNHAVHVTLLAVGTFALVLFVLLGMLLWQNPPSTTLKCSRASNVCTLVLTRQGQMRSRSMALDSLAGARVVDSMVNPTNSAGRYQIYLYGMHVNDYFFTTYDTLSEASAATEYINKFIANKVQTELVIVHDESTKNVVAWILMLVMPVFIIGILVFAWRKLPS